ncbi:hypothetical protein EX30DRAFT_341654 [Ascodesmis nigricans]|uniref:Uncharacterized protein n=1 Tax=Ascodesmis nigricans TaxID=341454 RepID=A0A4S2MV87_9PEZI|nr:hypothetical protein EX30DRAFT_341654 [Ascodesmis nigricans]
MPDRAAILQSFAELRDSLVLLKENRSTYIRTHDALAAHDKLAALLQKFENAGSQSADSASPPPKDERVIDQCLHMISLLFLTVGRNNEAPAMYTPCVITKRLLDHLTESGNYSAKDVQSVPETLQKYNAIIETDPELSNLLILARVRQRLESCYEAVKPLQTRLSKISPTLYPVYEKLVSLRRMIKAAEARRKFSPSEVEDYLYKIREIDATKQNGKFVGDDGTTPSEGQDEVQALMERAYQMAEEAQQRHGQIDPSLKDKAEILYGIKSRLERLELTQAWSLREADLYEVIDTLFTLDDERKDGKFIGSDGSAPTEGQSILLYLIRRSYAHIYTLLNSSEPVSEALTPIFNQLQTVQRCLKEVQKYGIQHPRELYPYSMKLASIDNMRVDGKWMVGDDIPEGQGRVASLLAECYEICQELRSKDFDEDHPPPVY